MMTLMLLLGAAIGALALWAMVHGSRREKPGAANNWRNEDYLSREADRTWTEGSTYSRSPPRDSSGLDL
jgi:hypothetical protein